MLPALPYALGSLSTVSGCGVFSTTRRAASRPFSCSSAERFPSPPAPRRRACRPTPGSETPSTRRHAGSSTPIGSGSVLVSGFRTTRAVRHANRVVRRSARATRRDASAANPSATSSRWSPNHSPQPAPARRSSQWLSASASVSSSFASALGVSDATFAAISSNSPSPASWYRPGPGGAAGAPSRASPAAGTCRPRASRTSPPPGGSSAPRRPPAGSRAPSPARAAPLRVVTREAPRHDVLAHGDGLDERPLQAESAQQLVAAAQDVRARRRSRRPPRVSSRRRRVG